MIRTVRPPWTKVKAVADWVMHHADLPDDDICRFLDDVSTSREQEAVEAAKRGDLHPLADIFEAAAKAGNPDQDHPSAISPSTLQLAAEFLSSKRKRQRGRQKMSKAERAERTPTHFAAKYYFPAVKKILREGYPEQTPEDIRDRALEIVESMTGAKKETVAKYRNEPKRDPRRI
jgi:hypothetical protein